MSNTTTTTLTPEVIANAIKAAQEAANSASTQDDGGTCNLDTVIIDFTGWRQKKIDQIASMAGVDISEALSGWHKGYRFINFDVHGQGNNRSRMVEAAKKKLCELGVTASIYYQMD